MKKTLIVLMMVALVFATAFAATGTDDIQLKSSIAEVRPGSDPATFGALVNIVCTTTGVTPDGNVYDGLFIDTKQATAKQSLDFQIENAAFVRIGTTTASYSVTVTPGPFTFGTSTVNVACETVAYSYTTTSDYFHVTGGTWADDADNSASKILSFSYASGVTDKDEILGKFKLTWTPKANLPVGDYTSDVVINVATK